MNGSFMRQYPTPSARLEITKVHENHNSQELIAPIPAFPRRGKELRDRERPIASSLRNGLRDRERQISPSLREGDRGRASL